jgi:hypothetical protein
MRSTYPVPSYLPDAAVALVPWARDHVSRVARRYNASRDELWDEALTALLRAALHYEPASGAFPPYGRTAVHRGLWRFVIRRHQVKPTQSLSDTELERLSAHSPEDELLAREAVMERMHAEELRQGTSPTRPRATRPHARHVRPAHALAR